MSRTTLPASGAISLQNVTKKYGDYLALTETNLDIAAGEFISLLGPSGSGKTTTLMMIAGFELPTSGRVLLDGKDITRLPAHKRDLGIIFQNYALFPHMTVAENIAYPLRMRRVGRAETEERVTRVLAQVHLEKFAARLPHQLSGGQQQRVAIARALVFDPPVLLLDEPLGALDKKLRHHLRNEIKALHAEVGKTMIFVTHDQEEALALSDRVVVMSEGRIRQVAPPQELYNHPADLFVAGFVGDANLLSAQVSEGRACLEGGVSVALAGSLPAGVATLCIRPENVRVTAVDSTGAAGATEDGAVPAVISDAMYLGDAVMLTCKTASGVEISAKVFNRINGPDLTPGRSCMLRWAPEAVTLLPGTA